LVEGKYESQSADENNRFWIPELNLFLGTWNGKRSQISTTWLRWWDSSGNLLLWGKEIIEQERQRAQAAELELQKEQAQRQRLVDRLKVLDVDLDLDLDED
jgi:hypothetical protein